MPGAEPVPHSGQEQMLKERLKSWTCLVMTLLSSPSHPPALTDVNAISIIEFPASATNPVVPWGWQGRCAAHTASPSPFQPAHGIPALLCPLAHSGLPSSTNIPGPQSPLGKLFHVIISNISISRRQYFECLCWLPVCWQVPHPTLLCLSTNY